MAFPLSVSANYNLTPIGSLAETLRRGAKDVQSNDATVALNNAAQLQFEAETQLAKNALNQIGNAIREKNNAELQRDLLNAEIEYKKEFNDDVRKQDARAALAQIALGGFGDAVKPQRRSLENEMVAALNFGQNLRNAGSYELSDYGINPQANLGLALENLVRPKSKLNKKGGTQLNPTPQDQAPNVKLESFTPNTQAMFEFLSSKLKPKT